MIVPLFGVFVVWWLVCDLRVFVWFAACGVVCLVVS